MQSYFRFKRVNSLQTIDSYKSINNSNNKSNVNWKCYFSKDKYLIQWRKMNINDCLKQFEVLQQKNKNILFDHPFPLLSVISKQRLLNKSDVLIQSLLCCNKQYCPHKRNKDSHLNKSASYIPDKNNVSILKSNGKSLNQTTVDVRDNKPANIKKVIIKPNRSNLFNKTQVIILNPQNKIRKTYSKPKISSLKIW